MFLLLQFVVWRSNPPAPGAFGWCSTCRWFQQSFLRPAWWWSVRVLGWWNMWWFSTSTCWGWATGDTTETWRSTSRSPNQPQGPPRMPRTLKKHTQSIKPHKVFLDVDKGQVFSSSKQVKGSLAEEHCQRKYHPKGMNVSMDLVAQQKKR